MTVGANDKISMINLIRVGADTHDFNPEQRLIPVPFTQSGTQITATLSASPELAPPGYYMLFVFNTAGVPAVAKIISIGPVSTSTASLVVTPSTNIAGSGTQYGPFLPVFQYQLSASSGSIGYSITNLPSWLSASPASGTLTTMATTVTFTYNNNSINLAVGSYGGSVNFNNTTNGQGNTTRGAALTVTPLVVSTGGGG